MSDKDEMIRVLQAENDKLQEENKKLQETVDWMHDLIWKMLKERERTKEAST